MYKGKIQIWISLIVLSLIISNFGLIKNFFNKEDLNVLIDIDETMLATQLGYYEPRGFNFNQTFDENNADIIIRNESDNQLTGYTKYPKQFYSPIVMFVPDKAYDSKEIGFSKNKTETSSSTFYYLQKDLKVFLEALENDKKYVDIGISEKIFGNGKVQIAIPDKNVDCYDEVRLLIMLTLNNYSYDNLDDKNLIDRTNAIIDKCIKYENATECILDNIRKDDENKENRNNLIVLAPEYIIINSTSIGVSDSSSDCYINCFPLKTINVYYDVYIRDSENNTHEKLLNSFTKKKLIDKTGLRNKEIDFDIRGRNGFSHSIKNVPLIKEN